jgi:hypothetical protein
MVVFVILPVYQEVLSSLRVFATPESACSALESLSEEAIIVSIDVDPNSDGELYAVVPSATRAQQPLVPLGAERNWPVHLFHTKQEAEQEARNLAFICEDNKDTEVGKVQRSSIASSDFVVGRRVVTKVVVEP